jgi:hypothetical protein
MSMTSSMGSRPRATKKKKADTQEGEEFPRRRVRGRRGSRIDPSSTGADAVEQRRPR